MSDRIVVRLSNLGVSYRRKKGFMRHEYFWALKNITFDVCAGEVLGIIGRNGAGKSTLLSVLSNIISPDEGEISFHHDCYASLLSLQPGFVGQLTGRANIILGGMLLGMSRKHMQEEMENINSFSELGEFIDQPIYTYSSGMRARLGFSLAMYTNPEIILIDEVLGVGDQGFKEKTSKVIREMMSSGKTIVLVSHNMGVIRKHCNRVVWIDGGKIRDMGSPDEVLKKYEVHFRNT